MNFEIFDFIAIIVSIIALGSSLYVGIKQVKISQFQADIQNRVELYLSPQSINSLDAKGQTVPTPQIVVQNAGTNVLYIEKYILNGQEFPFDKFVLPPMAPSVIPLYIPYPVNTSHVSFEIYFLDWQKNLWITRGYGDVVNGFWTCTYSPCERR